MTKTNDWEDFDVPMMVRVEEVHFLKCPRCGETIYSCLGCNAKFTADEHVVCAGPYRHRHPTCEFPPEEEDES